MPQHKARDRERGGGDNSGYSQEIEAKIKKIKNLKNKKETTISILEMILGTK